MANSTSRSIIRREDFQAEGPRDSPEGPIVPQLAPARSELAKAVKWLAKARVNANILIADGQGRYAEELAEELRLEGLRRSDPPHSPDAPPKALAEELVESGFDVTITYTAEGGLSIAIRDASHRAIDLLKSIDESCDVQPPVSTESDLQPGVPTLGPSLFHRDAGLFSYTAGVLGAAAFMALAIGPGWLGFVVAYLPASLLASWAVSDYA